MTVTFCVGVSTRSRCVSGWGVGVEDAFNDCDDWFVFEYLLELSDSELLLVLLGWSPGIINVRLMTNIYLNKTMDMEQSAFQSRYFQQKFRNQPFFFLVNITTSETIAALHKILLHTKIKWKYNKNLINVIDLSQTD